MIQIAPSLAQTLPQQDPSQRAIQNQNYIERQNEKQNQFEEQQKLNQQPRSKPALTLPKPLEIKPGGPCFKITRVELEGYEVFGKKPDGYDNVVGQCVDLSALGALLDKLNIFYQKEGYISTRAYLPAQDLKTGVLKIIIIPGRIGGFVYRDGKPVDLALQSAFPVRVGDILKLRDLEQGLDNYNSLASQQAQFILIPGDNPGESLVQLDVKRSKRWYGTLSVDNGGTDSTGRHIGSLNANYDNLIGLNDTVSVTLNSNTDVTNKVISYDVDNRYYQRSANIAYTLLYGNYSLKFAESYSRYQQIITGINQAYVSHGTSNRPSVELEQMIWRGQSFKYYMFGNLSLYDSRSYISDVSIVSQARDLTPFKFGFRGRNYFGQLTLDWRLSLTQGLPILGAHSLNAYGLDYRFTQYNLTMDASYPLTDTLKLLSSFGGQLSRDHLPSSQQFSIGGRYDVRGYDHGDDFFGNGGAYVRNTAEYLAYHGHDIKLTLFSGLDGGYIIPQKDIYWSRHNLEGAVFGARAEYFMFKAEVSYARALVRPVEFTNSKNTLYFTVSASF